MVREIVLTGQHWVRHKRDQCAICPPHTMTVLVRRALSSVYSCSGVELYRTRYRSQTLIQSGNETLLPPPRACTVPLLLTPASKPVTCMDCTRNIVQIMHTLNQSSVSQVEFPLREVKVCFLRSAVPVLLII